MNIQTLKVFRDLVAQGSFSLTAQHNDISQSAVSQQVRSLEKRYGVPLIERSKKNFSLTPEGKILYKACEKILDIYQAIDQDIAKVEDKVAGDLRIASVYSIGLHELPPFLRVYREQYPKVHVKMDFCKSSVVYEKVADGQADLGLVAYPQRHPGIAVEAFWQDLLVLICGPAHPIASRRQVRLKNLQNEAFIAFAPDQPTAQNLKRRLKQENVQPRVILELDNIEAVKRAVEIEQAVSVVPLTTVHREAAAGILKAIAFQDDNMWRSLGLLLKRRAPLSPASSRLVAMLKTPPPGLVELGAIPSN